MSYSRNPALLKGVGAGILFGTASIFIRLLYDVDSIVIVLWRLLIASLAIALILLITRPQVQARTLWELSRPVVVLGILIGLHFLLFVSAVKDTTILHATVLVNTTPIFAMFFSILLYRARPSWASALGVLIAFTGMIALTLPETALGLLGNLRGDMEATIASLVEGLYLNLGKGVREKIPALVAMLPIYLAATALVMGATRVCGHSIAIPLDSSALLLLIGLGLLPTALGHTLYFSSLSGLKSYQTATMALLEPMIATALGLVLFAEAPNIQSLLGAAMILLGISLVIRE